MVTSQVYIIIALVVLLILALLIFFVRKKRQPEKISPLVGLAFGFILAGIIFTDNRLLAYSLMGVGVALAIIDMILKSKKRKK
jgi:LPXTG-motif cell wall-anchored protein